MKTFKQWISLLLVVAMLGGTLSAYAGFFEVVQDDVGGENSSYIEQEEKSAPDQILRDISREMYDNFLLLDPEVLRLNDKELICMHANLTSEQYDFIEQLTREIVVGCKTADEEIRAVAEYLARNVYYCLDYSEHPYDVLTDGMADCGGYAGTFEVMMLILGHPCGLVLTHRHAWNMVHNGSRWIPVDTTWMAPGQVINGEKVNDYGDYVSWRAFDFDPEWVTEEDDHVIRSMPYTVYDGMLYSFPRYTTFSEYTISDRITAIGPDAFYNNYSLTKITIPDSVTGIWEDAFSCSYNLKEIVIPDSVTFIGDGAFSSCLSLTSLTIPGSVKTIGENAFNGCSGLTEVVMLDGVKSIGERAFQYCNSLESVYIPASVTEISNFAFVGNEQVEVYYEGSEEDWQAIAIGTASFHPNVKIHYNWDGEKEFNTGTCGKNGDHMKWTYSAGVLTITGSGEMFWYLRNNDIAPPWYHWKDDITKIVIGDGITYISNTFDYCSKLKELYIGEGVDWIDEMTFYYCSSLETVTLPKSLKEIGYLAFGDCKNLKTVYYAGSKADWEDVYDTEDLSSATIVFNASQPESEPDTPFTDVPADAYYADAVEWAYKNGITTGKTATTFGPKENCTRGQVVTFLWRAKGQPEPKSTNNPFTDVKATDYFYKAVLWAVENGITNGTSATTFDPKATCTSGHVVTFLWRANGEPAAVGKSTLAAANDGKWYSKAVAWADSIGLLSGTDTAFAVTNQSPRADIVTYLYRDAVK